MQMLHSHSPQQVHCTYKTRFPLLACPVRKVPGVDAAFPCDEWTATDSTETATCTAARHVANKSNGTCRIDCREHPHITHEFYDLTGSPVPFRTGEWPRRNTGLAIRRSASACADRRRSNPLVLKTCSRWLGYTSCSCYRKRVADESSHFHGTSL
jgi:hypothetical protein